MFSSEPFVAEMFVPDAFPLAEDAGASVWMPEDMELATFPALDDLTDLSLGDDALYAPVPNAMPLAVQAAVEQALAAREVEETALRERMQAEAYAAGVEVGRAEAEAAAHTALSSAIEALWLATEEVRAGESRWLAALEDNVSALVAGAARHVIAREVQADDALVRDLAARAVAEYPQDHPLHVRVNPADLTTLKTAFAAAPRTGDLRWTADARVERGGCVVEGRDRIVDGRVDTALERVYRTLGKHHV